MKVKGMQIKYEYLLKNISQSSKLLYKENRYDDKKNKNDENNEKIWRKTMRKYENIMNYLFIKEDIEKLNSMWKYA